MDIFILMTDSICSVCDLHQVFQIKVPSCAAIYKKTNSLHHSRHHHSFIQIQSDIYINRIKYHYEVEMNQQSGTPGGK